MTKNCFVVVLRNLELTPGGTRPHVVPEASSGETASVCIVKASDITGSDQPMRYGEFYNLLELNQCKPCTGTEVAETLRRMSHKDVQVSLYMNPVMVSSKDSEKMWAVVAFTQTDAGNLVTYTPMSLDSAVPAESFWLVRK